MRLSVLNEIVDQQDGDKEDCNLETVEFKILEIIRSVISEQDKFGI